MFHIALDKIEAQLIWMQLHVSNQFIDENRNHLLEQDAHALGTPTASINSIHLADFGHVPLILFKHDYFLASCHG
jgi:hypothetical protein